MITPINKIKSLLNEDIVSLFGDEVINNAYIEAYRLTLGLISNDAILESLLNSGLSVNRYYTTHTTTSDNDAGYFKKGFGEGRKILSVLRKNSDGTDSDDVYYRADKIPSLHGETRADNINSIYYENDRWNPKYYIQSSGSIVILPKDSTFSGEVLPKAKIYWITFPDFSQSQSEDLEYTFNLTNKNFSTMTINEEGDLFYGIPSGAKELVYTEMALNLVQNYIADFVYDEEDTELLSLAQEHTSMLMAKKKQLIDFVIPNYSDERQA